MRYIRQTITAIPSAEAIDTLYLGSLVPYPEGPCTQHLRTLVPNTIKGMVFGTRDLKYWVLGPSGLDTGHRLRALTLPSVRACTAAPTRRHCQHPSASHRIGRSPTTSLAQRGPCTITAYTWALKGFLYPYFGAYMYRLYRYLDPFGSILKTTD